MTLSKRDLYYLRSIQRQLDQLTEAMADAVAERGTYGLQDEVLADNRDWLDCFIDKHTKETKCPINICQPGKCTCGVERDTPE